MECDGDPTSNTGEKFSLQSSLVVKNSRSLHHIGRQVMALCGNLHRCQLRPGAMVRGRSHGQELVKAHWETQMQKRRQAQQEKAHWVVSGYCLAEHCDESGDLFSSVPHQVWSALGRHVSALRTRLCRTVFIFSVALRLCPSVKMSNTIINSTKVRRVSVVGV